MVGQLCFEPAIWAVISTTTATSAPTVAPMAFAIERRCLELRGPQHRLDLDRAFVDASLAAAATQRGRDLRTRQALGPASGSARSPAPRARRSSRAHRTLPARRDRTPATWNAAGSADVAASRSSTDAPGRAPSPPRRGHCHRRPADGCGRRREPARRGPTRHPDRTSRPRSSAVPDNATSTSGSPPTP